VKIGSVPYLNVRPLIYGIEEQVTQLEPARLADGMYRRQFEVGMVPVAEVLWHDQYDVVDGIAIAARGEVRSVFLTHRVPVAQVRRVAITPASRTSVWLLRVLLKVQYGIAPEFYPQPPGATLADHEAILLIGDEAIRYGTRAGALPVWDLGAAWVAATGLPFVFAVWAVQRGLDVTKLAPMLRRAKADGLAHIEDIVRNSTEATPEFRREYLTRYVCYELGAQEKAGIRRFQELCGELQLVDRAGELRYVS